MKIGNYGFIPSQNINKFNNKADVQQPTITSPQDSYQQRGKELAAKVLGDKMAEQLGLPVQEKKAEKPLFDFEEIVKNVLDFVTGAVNKAKADGADDDKLKGMLSDARKGVQIGIDDAVDELKESGVLNDETQEGINKSKEGIFNGLDEFEDNLFNPMPASVGVTQAQYASLSNNAQYSFTTAEGDEVTISFADAFKSQSASSYQRGKGGEAFVSESSQSRELSFSMSVNGDLNDKEQEAINELMENLQNVSKTFFSGDLDQAFEEAQELSLGNEQLVAFSMDLRQTKTVAAIKGYEENKPAPEKVIADKIAPFNDDLREAFSKAAELDIQNQLSGIMQWLNEDQSEIDKLVDYTKAMFENLNKLNSAAKQTADEV
ncbi:MULTISPECIES: DUF5610 domain-containing protein [unclassified Pseudoalteromonas]|uniref:DUF5610 domain-containing protein n=1 Tax=unclassified Pseudoalteromonas TaxID=194690 RepID=UPI001109DBA4|nr:MULTISPECIES: DUF5610 domain-containing protein [unclassified Pseudoalteromonas]TMN77340.1 hypothetical protein CWB64_17605 [Pseudoalteromonas sp. S410]TMN87308.1 hypothetical protein CWB62_18270 [Pseudoalteromonas sp. S408]TMN95750.1 hypothetical protein CWB61_13540 [Pseudoalteromonas sp. S407]TMN96134.1 hypothetical protein CWB63_16910 [Pseudoalteromonas sp. S409]TMO09049.1 hypothetical protein CWB57_13050 [Pseudoalteromonas sp. S186]